MNYVHWLQRISWKCLSQQRKGRTSWFYDLPKNFAEDLEILLTVKFRWIPFSGCRGEIEHVSEAIEILLPVKFPWISFSGCRGIVKNVSANYRPGRPSRFSDWPEKHKLRKRTLKSWFLSSFVEFHSAAAQKKSKTSQPIRGQGDHLGFSICKKYTNLVEGVEISLPIKFRWIPFSCCREDVENVKS